MSVIGNSPGVASQRVVSPFTATSGQTTFTPISGYTLGYCDVFLNGIKLANGDDYTAADGTTVVLAVGAALGDFVEVVAYFPRGLSDGYLKSEADAKFLAKTGGTLTGDLVLDNGSADGAQVVLKSLGYSNWNIDNYSGKLRAYYNATEYFNIDASGNLSLLSGNFLHGGPSSNVTGAQSLSWKTSPDTTTVYPRLSLAQQTATGADHAWTFRTQGNGTLHLSHSDQFAWNTFTDKLTIDNGGNTTIAGNLVLASGKGIDFSANGNAGGKTGELLDDYEEGNWTPAISGGTLTPNSIPNAKYVKIGALVHIQAYMRFDTATGNGTALIMEGLPFAATSDNGYVTGGMFSKGATGGVEVSYPHLRIRTGSTYIDFFKNFREATLAQNEAHGDHFMFSATYYTDA